MSQEVTIKKSTYNQILAGIVVLAIAFSFTLGFVIGEGKIGGSATNQVVQQPQQQAPTNPEPEAPSRVQVSLDDDPVLGNANAPLTVIEFSDFECPFCGRAFTDAVAGIKRDYVDTGKVKLVYRDFPLSFHPQALPAALAAECAKEQNKFWEMHDKIFTNQGSLSEANYKAWAKEFGLNEAQFNSCVDSRKYESEIQKDMAEGSSAGVSGTPTFYIGNAARGYVQIVGARPYAVIQQIIEQELAS
jgi:protein-disulfide isomerase